MVVAGAWGGGSIWAARGTGSLAGPVGGGKVEVGRRWRAWPRRGERERWWRGLGVGVLYGQRGEGEVGMGQRWRSWWRPGERERRERVVEARWRCGECGRRGRVCRAGGERESRRLGDRVSSLGWGQSGGVGGSWGASRGAAWYGGGVWYGGGGPWWQVGYVDGALGGCHPIRWCCSCTGDCGPVG